METIECPSCGASARPSARTCDYCKAEFFVTSLAYLGDFDADVIGRYIKHYKDLCREDPNNVEGVLGLGLCYLKTGLCSLAQKSFQRVIEESPEISQAYYYYALSCINGRRLRTLSLNEVRRIESYLDTAIRLDRGSSHYKLLLAMVKRDYYEMNGMKVPPPVANEILIELAGQTIDRNEIERLGETARVANAESYLGGLHIV